MMADHDDPCNELETSYCMNGGTCLKIPFIDTLTCVCSENYKGSRCELYQLLITAHDAGETGLIAAVVIMVLLILVVFTVVIYYTCKVWKAKPKNQQKNSEQQYWRVEPRE
ncbi:pro-neuregulin-4, membrane-bound isoform [Salmo trutta]|uniref:pro-neuregulin-4, membrane-bound isoform n=1 Tax=Salmo trutta TaxID=8032 RepID=UPI0011303FD0|nr:pro-neuregulin-4, membrane-bound isoform [Salmo trutta]